MKIVDDLVGAYCLKPNHLMDEEAKKNQDYKDNDTISQIPTNLV